MEPPVAATIVAAFSKDFLVTISLGSGRAGDVHFLFAEDILGENKEMLPRHAKAYRKFHEIREKMQNERISAFKEFRKEVYSGKFPQDKNIVDMDAAIINEFIEKLDKNRRLLMK